ncbi:glycosyltransferase [Moritella yayanosii]|uniref:Glycosyl transferase family 1 domain-containing protein n=1 Tax=Moritella yayanosii TaxID=69539 RepID=A0A330LLX7_9GAMM|nr:glycosyltransferase [Moritella yayanosii]SQD78034.1 protein of unknown function, might belong to Glycogen synthase [Moritella yayanosii]
MKHIAIVVPEFPIASETFIVTEIQALAKAGHKVTVFCFIKRELDITLPAITTKSLLLYGAKLAYLASQHHCAHFHCHFMHRGVDVSRFITHSAPKNKQLELLFVGHVVEKKGIVYALQALALIAENQRPHLDIVGQGLSQKQLYNLIKKLKLKVSVRLLGYRSPHWIGLEGSNHDCFVAPFFPAEDGDSETEPMVLNEAMAMGLPVITSHVMALKLAIESFMQCQNNVREQMRVLARQRVEQYFNAQIQARRLSHLIEGTRIK